MAATVIGKPFLDWIKQKIQERNAAKAQKQGQLIQMDPALANAFQNSTHHSNTPGTGAHLLKEGSKRRRTSK